MKASMCLLYTLVLVSTGVIYSKDRSVSTAGKSGPWVDISAKVIQSLTREGKKIGYPGKTGGISADRITSDVFMVIPDQGIWRSSDHGNSFTRVDSDKIGGR